MKVVGIIPARFDSVRLPGKPLMMINGKSMIQRVYEQSLKSKLIRKVVIATDDKRIFDEVINFGGYCIMTSSRHQSGTDRICEAAKKTSCDVVVNIQGDEPFIDPDNIDKAIAPLLSETKLNVSTLAIRIKRREEINDPNKVKVVFDMRGNALYFSRSVIPFPMNKTGTAYYYKHIGLYVFRKKFLMKFSDLKKSKLEKTEKLEQLRILENGERIRVVMTNTDSVSVDTIDDLKKLNK